MEEFEEIDVQDAKELIDQNNITIVDVRDQNAFNEGHIKNAQNINDSNIEGFINDTDKQKPLLCYCYLGQSSKAAAQYFKDNGFKTVYSMTGGYTEWQKVYDIS